MNNDIKVALITGGGTGIGRSSALALQEIGFNVIICGRREDPLKETALLADPQHPKITVCTTDVSEGKSVGKLFNKILEDFGRLDVIFNNAGMGAPRVPFDALKVAAVATFLISLVPYNSSMYLVTTPTFFIPLVYLVTASIAR